jgi:hypothetical protein
MFQLGWRKVNIQSKREKSMRMNLKAASMGAFIVASLSSASVFATTENNKTIQLVGVQGNGPSYVTFNEALTVGCEFGLIYLPDAGSAGGKAMLAALLSAQASGKGVQRVDYAQAADGTCTASVIAVGP